MGGLFEPLIKVTVNAILCVVLLAGDHHSFILSCAVMHCPPEGEVTLKQRWALLSVFSQINTLNKYAHMPPRQVLLIQQNIHYILTKVNNVFDASLWKVEKKVSLVILVLCWVQVFCVESIRYNKFSIVVFKYVNAIKYRITL